MTSRERTETLAITGLDTFCGVRIAERLLDGPNPPRIVGLDLRVPSRLEDRIRFHAVDLTEPTADSQVAELLEKNSVDTVLHAAFFERPQSDRRRAHELEVIGSLHVMNAAAAARVQQLVVTSTAEVYGPRPDNPSYLTEAHALRAHPDSHVARDRAEMEQLLGLFAERHPNIDVCSLRPCWIVGPRIDTRAQRHFERQRVTTLLGYDPLVQFLHESDWLDAIERALVTRARGAFNLAGDGALPLGTLLRLAGKRARPLLHSVLYRAGFLGAIWTDGDPPAGFYDYLRFGWSIDTTRAREELGWRPAYSTKEAWMSFVSSRRLRSYR